MPELNARALLRGLPPFDRLARKDFEAVAGAVSVRRLSPGEAVLQRQESPQHYFLVAEGIIEETDAGGVIARYTAGSGFDCTAIIEGRSQHAFVSRGPSTCHQLPASVLVSLVHDNALVREHIRQTIDRRLDEELDIHLQREAASFLVMRVGETALHPPRCVPAHTSLGEAMAMMDETRSSALLVRDGNRLGIFTSRDVREQFVLRGLAEATALGDLASFDLKTVDHAQYLMTALVLMSRNAIRHLVVTRGAEIIGIFEQSDLSPLLAHSAFGVAALVERATSGTELKSASDAIPRVVRSLQLRGVKPRHIARLVTALNRKLFRGVFDAVVPPDLRDRMCLMVMGSEGRSEQLLRTDQDNGLILADELPEATVRAIAEAFSGTLTDMGFPPCPGNVMVSNRQWTKSLATFKRDLDRWLSAPSGDAFLNLAILYDARAVAGDETIAEALKSHIHRMVQRQDAFVGHFAKTALGFPTPIGLFNRIITERSAAGERVVNIKKGGMFPIVHGIRSLALKFGMVETNTIQRIQMLRMQATFGSSFTADLIAAFEFMSMLRLREHLTAWEQARPHDNFVRIDNLDATERNLLRDSLKIVKEFKSVLTQHFRLNLLT